MAAAMIKLALVLIVAASTLFKSSDATIYRVGDNNGWKVPDGYGYNDWADTHKFVAGDILEFDFITGQDTVASVSWEDYSNCNTFSPLNVQTFGPANFTLSSGQCYFISLEDGHCLQGERLAVNVSTYGQSVGFGSPFPFGSVSPPYPYVAPPIAAGHPPPPPFGNASPYFGFRSAATIPAATTGGGVGTMLFLLVVIVFLF